MRRALDLDTGSRVWLQLRPAEGHIHIRVLAGPADRAGAVSGGDPAAAADSGVDASDDYSDSGAEGGDGDEGGAAAAGPAAMPAAVQAGGAAVRQAAAAAPQVLGA